jgi:predicted N-acetyltransferase YhbS
MANDLVLRSATDWEEVEQATTVAQRAFPHRNPDGTHFYEQTVEAPMIPLENTLVATLEEEIVSQLQIYERPVFVDGRIIYTGEVGNVCTLPSHRNQGYAGQLLEYAQEFMAQKGYAYSMLGAGNKAYYSRFGWEPISYPQTIATDPKPTADSDVGMWREFEREADLDRIQTIYQASHRSVDGKMARTANFWRNYILSGKTDIEDENVLLHTGDGDEPSGYLVWDRREGAVHCFETGFVGAESDEEVFFTACWDWLTNRDAERLIWHPQFPEEWVDPSHVELIESTRQERLIQVYGFELLSELTDEKITSTGDFVAHLESGGWYWSTLII